MEERIIKDINNLLTQLFQKMKEAGYEWDAEKKELKKIEQDPAWSDDDEKMLNTVIEDIVKLAGPYVCYRTDVEWLKSLKGRVQPKQDWSQNDIDMIDWLIRCCEKEHEELCNDKYGHQDIVSDLKRDCRKKWDWLESLKSRVAPQKQWKPTEEQIEAVKCAALDVAQFSSRSEKLRFENEPYYKALVSLYDDLKKLR